MKHRLPMLLVLAVIVGGVTIMGMRFVNADLQESAKVEVTVPELSPAAQQGAKAFKTVCAQCHGDNASGSDKGPPLVHDFYNPGHHADGAFFTAVKRGVQAHHWPFGNMPPQPSVSEKQVSEIVQYVRELQQANGIHYRKHTM